MSIPTVEDLRPRILKALRDFQHPNPNSSRLLNDLYLAKQLQTDHKTDTPHALTKKLLVQALTQLTEKQPAAAALLTSRFINSLSVRESAKKLHITESTFSKRQRAAIHLLSEQITIREYTLRQQHAEKVTAHLPLNQGGELYGVAHKIEETVNNLQINKPPWLTVIHGQGGIGKTTLAMAVVRKLAMLEQTTKFIWVSCEAGDSAEATLTHIFSTIAATLALTAASPAQQKFVIRATLRTQPHLIIIDNLETVATINYLLQKLPSICNPSCCLLTSRVLPAVADVHSIPIVELDQAASFALMQQMASQVKLPVLTSADMTNLFKHIGGNPYAIKLTVPLAKHLPMAEIIADLPRADLQGIQHLYAHIFANVWETLSEVERQLLQPLAFLTDYGILSDDLQAMSGLGKADFLNAVDRLTTLSLLEPRHTRQARVFGLHRLFVSFLRTKFGLQGGD